MNRAWGWRKLWHSETRENRHVQDHRLNSRARKSGAYFRGHDRSEFDLIFSNSHRAGEVMKRQNRAYSGCPRVAAYPLGGPHRPPCPRRLRGAEKARGTNAEMPWRVHSSRVRPWHQTPGLTGARMRPRSITSPSTSGPRSAVHGG